MRETDDILSQAGGRGAECLSPAQLEAMLAGTANEAARSHAGSCAHCQAEVALMKQFFEAEPTAAEQADVRQIERELRQTPAWRPDQKPATGDRGWFSRWFSNPMMGLAAAGVAAALALGIWWGAHPSQLGVERVDPGITRSTDIQGVEPAGDLAQAPAALHWSAVPQAAGYEVALLDVEEKVLWSAKSSGTVLPLPVEARAIMTNRKMLFWRVAALDAQGLTLAASAPVRFRVVEPAQ